MDTVTYNHISCTAETPAQDAVSYQQSREAVFAGNVEKKETSARYFYTCCCYKERTVARWCDGTRKGKDSVMEEWNHGIVIHHQHLGATKGTCASSSLIIITRVCYSMLCVMMILLINQFKIIN